MTNATDDVSTTTGPTAASVPEVQMYRVYIKAPAERIWQAITDPEWTNRWGYTGYAHYDLRPGGAVRVEPNEEFRAQAESGGHPCPDVIIDGEVLEVDEPRKLVTTWRMLMDDTMRTEGFTTLTHEIKQLDGFCSLTVTHDLTGAPTLAAMIAGNMEDFGAGGGHAWALSDLKSLLETGQTLAGRTWTPNGT